MSDAPAAFEQPSLFSGPRAPDAADTASATPPAESSALKPFNWAGAGFAARLAEEPNCMPHLMWISCDERDLHSHHNPDGIYLVRNRDTRMFCMVALRFGAYHCGFYFQEYAFICPMPPEWSFVPGY